MDTSVGRLDTSAGLHTLIKGGLRHMFMNMTSVLTWHILAHVACPNRPISHESSRVEPQFSEQSSLH